MGGGSLLGCCQLEPSVGARGRGPGGCPGFGEAPPEERERLAQQRLSSTAANDEDALGLGFDFRVSVPMTTTLFREDFSEPVPYEGGGRYCIVGSGYEHDDHNPSPGIVFEFGQQTDDGFVLGINVETLGIAGITFDLEGAPETGVGVVVEDASRYRSVSIWRRDGRLPRLVKIVVASGGHRFGSARRLADAWRGGLR